MKFAAATLTATLLALLAVGPTDADARWYMRYAQAKHATKEYSKRSCYRQSDCVEWAVGPCYRRSPQRFTCFMGHVYRGKFTGRETTCNTALHWGVTQGYITLKRRGRPHCFPRRN